MKIQNIETQMLFGQHNITTTLPGQTPEKSGLSTTFKFKNKILENNTDFIIEINDLNLSKIRTVYEKVPSRIRINNKIILLYCTSRMELFQKFFLSKNYFPFTNIPRILLQIIYGLPSFDYYVLLVGLPNSEYKENS